MTRKRKTPYNYTATHMEREGEPLCSAKAQLVSKWQLAAVESEVTCGNCKARIAARARAEAFGEIEMMTDFIRHLILEYGLTPKEAQVAQDKAYGFSDTEIAKRIGLGRKAARERMRFVYRKLGLKDKHSILREWYESKAWKAVRIRSSKIEIPQASEKIGLCEE